MRQKTGCPVCPGGRACPRFRGQKVKCRGLEGRCLGEKAEGSRGRGAEGSRDRGTEGWRGGGIEGPRGRGIEGSRGRGGRNAETGKRKNAETKGNRDRSGRRGGADAGLDGREGHVRRMERLGHRALRTLSRWERVSSVRHQRGRCGRRCHSRRATSCWGCRRGRIRPGRARLGLFHALDERPPALA